MRRDLELPSLAVVVSARLLVNLQALIPFFLVTRRQGSDVHCLADLADVPACQVRQGLRFLLIALAELLPVGGRGRTFILAGPGVAGSSQTVLLAR